MPGLSGFQVVERLPAGPQVVFTTAYDQHAVQAFEVNAVDYLLKPVERERLERTLDRIARRRDDPARGEFSGVLERLAKSLRAPPLHGRRVPERFHQPWSVWSSGQSEVSLTLDGAAVLG